MLLSRALAVLLTILTIPSAVVSCAGSHDEHESDPPSPGPDAAPPPVCDFPPTSCTSFTQCAGVTCGNECMYADCFQGQCKAFPTPQNGTPCQAGSYPHRTCDGAGACVIKQPDPGCITATTNGTEATGCDDANPCTQDVFEDGACQHRFYGIGTACGDPAINDGRDMQCWSGGSGEQCCPIIPACTHIGERGECAAGSVCMDGKCWVACDPDDPANLPANAGVCPSTPWRSCGLITQGTVARYICQ
jgi:hypothetical protein